MKLAIGENIKLIRKSKDITQEGLAEMLGVSCQSVSRWENGTCYPDMELLPVLAEIFNISVDKLLGVDDVIQKSKVDEYLRRFQKAISMGRIDECIAIAREGVAEYPNNYALLNKLMYALFVSGDNSGNIPSWNENMEKYDDEIVALGERIVKYCPDQDIRLEATSCLAFHHCEMGRRSIGRAIYETLPSQELCRENQIWWGLEEDEKLPFLRKKIRQDYEGLKRYIRILACTGLLSDEESVAAIKKVFVLEELICDGNRPDNSWGDARINCDIAEMYAKLGDAENMYRHLNAAVKSAKEFDNRPEMHNFSSLLLGTVELKKTDFESADTRYLCEIMQNSWLSEPVWDSFRETDEFKDILLFLEDTRA